MAAIQQVTKTVYCGIDFHKVTSTLCALDWQGAPVEPLTTIKTANLAMHLSNRRNWKIGIESTGGVNHIVAKLKEQGHEVVIINSNKFRGIGIGGKKTDARDALALAEALRLNFVPEVYHRTLFARELKSLLTCREHLVQARVSSMSHIRGTLREYGITMAAGAEVFYQEGRARIESLENKYIAQTLMTLFENILTHKNQEREIEARLHLIASEDERFERLQTIPGVGPISALTTMAVVDDITRFPTSKEFASYLGLVPSVSASANKRMMGSITRSGSEMLRRYLIHGARAWMRYKPTSDTNRIWAEKVKERRGMNKATVALAHRLARIIFAMLKSGTSYKSPTRSAAQASEE